MRPPLHPNGPSDVVRSLAALAWVSTVVALFLLRYDGWVIPFQAWALVEAALAQLGIGPYLPAFLKARLLDGLALLGILAAASGLGALVASYLIRERGWLAGLFAIAIGFWLLAVLVLLLAAIATRWVPLALVTAVAWLQPSTRQLWPRPRFTKPDWSAWEWFLVGCLVLGGMATLVAASTPPFEYDTLEYHLGAPHEYLQHGRLAFLPHNFYSNLPQLAEMLYLLCLTIASETAPKLLHWLFGMLSAGVVFTVGQRLWSRATGLTAAALFYLMPFVLDLSQTARIDLATTFFGGLVFAGLLCWRHHRQPGWLWLAALAAGGAVATKWTAIPVVLLPFLVFVLVASRSPTVAVQSGLVAGACVAPWLIKNLVLAGNPVYPLLHQWLPSPHWTVEQAALFAQKHYPAGGWLQLGDRIWHYSFVEPGALPLLLATAPLLLVTRQRQPAIQRAGWLFLAAYLAWFYLTFRPWRFLFPAMPLVAWLGAVGLAGIPHLVLRRLARGVVGGLLLIGLGMSLIGVTVDAENPRRSDPELNFIHYALGNVTAEEFVRRLGGGVLEPVIWMNQNLPPDAVVLYVGEARVFYAKSPVVWATAFDQHPLERIMSSVKSPAELAQALRRAGITHVFINGSEWRRLRQGYGYLAAIDDPLLVACLDTCGRLVHAHKTSAVYALDGCP